MSKYKAHRIGDSLDAAVWGPKRQIGSTMGVGDAEDFAAELNTLAAENARLREALGDIHKCANDPGVLNIARDALNK